MTMVFFFAIIMALGIWSSDDTGPHHPTYLSDTSWYEKELHATTQSWEIDHE